MNYFWKILWKVRGTSLKFYGAFHPQTDGSTAIINWSLDDLFRCVIGEKRGTWDLRSKKPKAQQGAGFEAKARTFQA